MSTTTANPTSVKSGEGLKHGVVSELTAFFGIQPGHAEELRAACERFADALRAATPESHLQVGLRSWKHVIFDNDQRLLLFTTFDTDWDPYIDDAVSNVGVERWIDWIQHTVEAEAMRAALGFNDVATREELEQAVESGSPGLKKILQAAQVPAVSFFEAMSDLSMGEIRKAQRVQQAFQQVLDDPAAPSALEQPALKPLLEQAAD